MKRDGNCFFLCLAETFLGNAELHADIRERVVCFMEMHKNTYVELIDGDFDEHIKLMRLQVGELVRGQQKLRFAQLHDALKLTSL